jgi:hypothetical protein
MAIAALLNVWTHKNVHHFQARSQNCKEQQLASRLSVRPSVSMEQLGS